MRVVKAVYEDQLESIAAKSLRNCHAEGLDSIMFDDTPEARVRCFVASAKHNMYRNSGTSQYTLSVALHSHHCDVKLIPIFGKVVNITIAGSLGGKKYRVFKYESEITTGKGKFVRHGEGEMSLTFIWNELKRRGTAMLAKEVHTIFLAWGEPAAWFVFEGKEDPNYNSLAYSDDDLERFDFAPLYQPMSTDYLRGLLETISVKIKSRKFSGE